MVAIPLTIPLFLYSSIPLFLYSSIPLFLYSSIKLHVNLCNASCNEDIIINVRYLVITVFDIVTCISKNCH